MPVTTVPYANYVKVTVYFNTGGINYANYKTYPKGFYLSVGPVFRTVEPGVTTERFTAFSAPTFFIEAAARFNAKRLSALAIRFLAAPGAVADALLEGRLTEFMNGAAVPASTVAKAAWGGAA